MRRLLLRHRTGKGGGFDVIELDPPHRPTVLIEGLTLPEVSAFIVQAGAVVVDRSRQMLRIVHGAWKALP